MLFVVGKISPDFRAYLTGHKIPYGLFVPVTKPRPEEPHAYAVDFTNPATIVQSLQVLNPAPQVTGVVVTGYEHYVTAAAVIAEYFNVPGMPKEAALAATDKIIMRSKFAAYDPAITPEFTEVKSWEDIVAFMKDRPFPAMLKPANLMKSLFITKNRSNKDLQKNYRELTRELPRVYENYGVGVPRILIEECMAGSMHTVAGFVDSTGTVTLQTDPVDCITAQDIGKDDNYLFARLLPSGLPDGDVTALQDVTRRGVAALGLTNTPIHAELILTDTGPKLIEIGARLGGYRPRMYGYARGIDMYRATLDTALARQVNISVTQTNACRVLEIFAERTAMFSQVTSIADIQKLKSFQYMKIHAKPGRETGRATEGFRAAAVVMLGHEDSAQVERDYKWVKEAVAIEVVRP